MSNVVTLSKGAGAVGSQSSGVNPPVAEGWEAFRLGRYPLKRARILIVEDNAVNLDLLTRRLERRGYETLEAMDGQVGFDRVRADRPDLVILDLDLPLVDGWTVARMIKADPTTRATPVLALTAHAMVGDRERALAAGCDDFESKPIDFPQLLEKISALLARRGTE